MYHNILCATFSGKSDRMSNPYLLPLGIVYCASALKQRSDCYVYSHLLDTEEYYRNENKFYEELMDSIIRNKIDIICISGLSVDYIRVKRIVSYIKQQDSNVCVIIGGGLVSADPEYVMEHILADFGIVGEGEESLPELISCLGVNDDYSEIRGLVYKNALGQITRNPEREIEDLDGLPLPDFSLFPEFEETIRKTGVYPILLSRACPFQCSFCFHTCGKRYRVRGVEHVLKEIVNAKKMYNIKHLFFLDELFGARMKELQILLHKTSELGLTFNAQTRADVVTEELVKLFKKTGCTNLSVGIESVSDSILESMGKKVSFAQIKEALCVITKYKLETSGNIIIGDVAETEETARRAIEWYQENREKYHLSIGMIQCYPGTAVFEYAIRNKLIQKERFLEQAEFPKDFVTNMTQMPEEIFSEIKKQVQILNFLHETSKTYLVSQ